ncbi:MAG: hypothetical protein NHG09_00065, partial [Candidatus Shikimatogenerans sp. JK-2022]|nr:hypothetical protein [Candidatus Shikimatogenerans bostrichidophilus]
NSLHFNIFKKISKKKININIIKAICVNIGPSISYTRIRNIISSTKGFCLALNLPLIEINDFLISIFKFKNKNLLKKKKNIFFIFDSFNKKKTFFIKFNFLKKIIYKKKKIKFLNLNKKKIFFINQNYKKKYKNKKNFFFYKILEKDIINFSYFLYKKKKFSKNINKCMPIYN